MKMEETRRGRGSFLLTDLDPDRVNKVREGHVVAQFWVGKGPVKVPNGLIHDWKKSRSLPDSRSSDPKTFLWQTIGRERRFEVRQTAAFP